MIIIVKKAVLLLILFTLALFCVPPFALARDAKWEIIYNEDDKSLEEIVMFNEMNDININADEWDISSSAGKTTIKRKITDWQKYNTLNDRFPVISEIKNYILSETVVLKGLENAEKQDLFTQLLAKGAIEFSVVLPGIKNKSNGEEAGDFKYIWNITENNDQVTLKANSLQGFILGVSLFSIGFLTIGIVFMTRMRKVNKLIAEEYSIEKAIEDLMAAKEAAEIDQVEAIESAEDSGSAELAKNSSETEVSATAKEAAETDQVEAIESAQGREPAHLTGNGNENEEEEKEVK